MKRLLLCHTPTPIWHSRALDARLGFELWVKRDDMTAGAAKQVYEEGIYIPITKIVDKGVMNDWLIDIIKANVRVPSRAMGDMRAQLAAIRTGAVDVDRDSPCRQRRPARYPARVTDGALMHDGNAVLWRGETPFL